MSRTLFTDGLNSLAHFTFGFIGATDSPIFVAGALVYQVLQGGVNMLTDIGEVLIGYLVGSAFS